MAKPLVMLGVGGHAAVLAEMLLEQKQLLIAVVAPDPIPVNSPLAGLKRITSDEQLLSTYSPEEVELVNGLGSIPGNNLRWKLFEFFSAKGFRFASVISPKANLSNFLELAEGVQIMMGAQVQTNASIGKNTIINTGAIVEHDCKIGAHNHIAPGVTLSGGVITASQVHIGTGASVIQSIKIGKQAVIGAGTSIVRDVAAMQTVVPAANRVISKEKIK